MVSGKTGCQREIVGLQGLTYGVPSGPVISALMTSTRVSSTRKKIELSHATGKFVVKTASYSVQNIKEWSQQ